MDGTQGAYNSDMLLPRADSRHSQSHILARSLKDHAATFILVSVRTNLRALQYKNNFRVTSYTLLDRSIQYIQEICIFTFENNGCHANQTKIKKRKWREKSIFRNSFENLCVL